MSQRMLNPEGIIYPVISAMALASAIRYIYLKLKFLNNVIDVTLDDVVTSGAGTAYPSGAPEFIPSLLWGSCYLIFSCICMLC
jgi:hypothetical protein